MVLKEQLAKQTALGIATAGMAMFFGVASFFFLSKLLPREDIAIMGISAGFLAMITPLMISPDVALFRNYSELKKDFNRFVTAFLLFWFVRTLAAMVVIAAGAYILFFPRGDFLFVYVIGAGLVMNLNMLQASIQEIFYVEFRQRDVLTYNFLYYSAFLLLLTAVFWKPELWIYLAIWLSLAIIFALAWFLRLKKAFRYTFNVDIPNAEKLIQNILSNVAIWTHLISSSVQVVYRADVFFLGLFALAFTTGNYTIALMISSMFIFLPQILQKMCMTGLTRSTTAVQDLKITNAFVKYCTIIAVLQLGGYFLVGEYLISFIDAHHAREIFELGLFIVVGVSIFSVVRPIHSLSIVRGDLKKLFVSVFLPTAIIALASYAIASYYWGGLATAQANILVYVILTILQLRYGVVHLGYRLPSEWVTREEWDLLKKIGRRIMVMRGAK